MLKMYAEQKMQTQNCKCTNTMCFQLRRKNINVFLRTKKPMKEDENVYFVYFSF